MNRPVQILAGMLAFSLASALPHAPPASGQSVLDRPPNLGGTWVGSPGVLHFNFNHRFAVSGPPLRKVTNFPTFFLGASLPGRTLVGARYSSNSQLVPAIPNEWEFALRVSPLLQSAGAPVDVALEGAYNDAAESFDGALTVARAAGPLRLLAVGRAFSDALRRPEARVAVAGGARLRLLRWLAVAGDAGSFLEREEVERSLGGRTVDVAWSAGLQMVIPTTPHTFSLQASNAGTTSLQGASRGVDDVRYGFEFTVPITLSRYFGGRRPPPERVVEAAEGEVAEVTMTNRLTFEPATLRIRAGQTVRWRNTSDLIHTVTADPALAQDPGSVRLPEGAETFDSGDLRPGDVFAHTFQVPGEYGYFCIPHELGGMVGTVIVTR